MKQYKITSADFLTPGETGEPDAYIDPADLAAYGVRPQPNGIPSLFANPAPYVVNESPAIIREQQYDGKATRNRIS